MLAEVLDTCLQLSSATPYLFISSPNTGKYRPENLRMRVLFTNFTLLIIIYNKYNDAWMQLHKPSMDLIYRLYKNFKD